MQKAQLKAARALKGWSQEDFAAVSGVSVPTMRRIEAGTGALRASPEVLDKIRKTLEIHGIEIQEPDATGGIGVRLIAADDLGRFSQLNEELATAQEALQAALRYVGPEKDVEALVNAALETVERAQAASAQASKEWADMWDEIGKED